MNLIQAKASKIESLKNQIAHFELMAINNPSYTIYPSKVKKLKKELNQLEENA